jgi:hypothetical protein
MMVICSLSLFLISVFSFLYWLHAARQCSVFSVTLW